MNELVLSLGSILLGVQGGKGESGSIMRKHQRLNISTYTFLPISTLIIPPWKEEDQNFCIYNFSTFCIKTAASLTSLSDPIDQLKHGRVFHSSERTCLTFLLSVLSVSVPSPILSSEYGGPHRLAETF